MKDIRKKIICILVFILTNINCYANEEVELPALPINEFEQLSEGDNLSIWQKITIFLGFGDKKKNDLEVIKATTSTDVSKSDEVKIDFPQLDEKKLSDDKKIINTLEEKFDGNAPIFENKKSEKTQNEQVNLNDLKLPEEFGPEELNDEHGNKNIKDISTSDPKQVVNVETKITPTQEYQKTEDATPQLALPPLKNIDTKDISTSDPKQVVNVETKITPTQEYQKTEDATPQLALPPLKNIDTKDISTSDPKQEVIAETKIAPIQEQQKTEDATPQLALPPLKIIDTQDISASDPKQVVIAETKIAPKQEQQKTEDINKNIPTNNKDQKTEIKSLIPSYSSDQELNSNNSNLSKYQEKFKYNKKEIKNIAQISSKELLNKNDNLAENDVNQADFIKNEAQVLTLPNDDVVLGDVIEEAKYEQMDFLYYINEFWNLYFELLREPKRKILDDYIKNYNTNFNENYEI